MTLASAKLANDQRVGTIIDELERAQLESGRSGQLEVEPPVEVRQGGLLGPQYVNDRCLARSIHQDLPRAGS